MKLVSLRVQNYKCIEDSEAFRIDQVTCLVGKNEAGKSALLEAFYKLNPVEVDKDRFFETEYPRRHVSTYRERSEASPDNVLTTEWELEEPDIHLLTERLGCNPLRSNRVIVTKGYDNVRRWQLQLNEEVVVRQLIAEAAFNAAEQSQVQNCDSVADLYERLQTLPNVTPKQVAIRERIEEVFTERDLAKTVRQILAARMPKLLYFSEYHKMLGRVSIDDLVQRQANNQLTFSHRIFLALLHLARSSPEEIQSTGTSEQLIMELEAIQNRLTDEIFEYWTQNRHLAVNFRFDAGRPDNPPPYNSGFIFETRILNNRHKATINFDERSTGFIWFFSFLVWLSQVKSNYGENVFVLLDEPGLSLHGKAQKDLMRYINERLRPTYQVIYTTHSPFMIDTDHIFSVRTVEDVVAKRKIDGEENEMILGTKVGERILSRDKDTILPLQGILGYDIAQTMFIGPYVLVVEGPAEAAYINWFSRKLLAAGRTSLDIRWAVAPAEGAGKVSSFVTLFRGRGLRIAALMDYHDGQKKAVDDLERSCLLEDGHLLRTTSYVSQEEADIEDLLGRLLYKSLIQKTYPLTPTLQFPSKKSDTASIRIVKEVEQHFRTLPPGVPEFDHYAPAACLHSLPEADLASLKGLDHAMNNFERLFADLNALI